MSLIHWWPFTDNTVDKINGKTFTSTNWSFQSNGKIGNCFAPSWTDSNTISRQIYADNVSIPETFSVAVWVKNNNNFNSPRTYCPIQFSNGDCWLTGANNKGWDFSHSSLRLIFNNGSNVSGNAGNAEVNWGYNPREFLGNWYHIAFTVNKTTRKAELFINGVSKGIKDLPSAVDTYGGTFKLKINWVQGWMLDGSLNDLRIYDHALSQAEVKELSKALVVHYSFNDTLSEPTTNVSTVSGWSAYGAYWTISERTETGLKLYRHTGSTSDCVAIQNSAVTSKMAQGDIWTFSCYLYKNGQPYKSTASGISSEGYGYKTVSCESHDDGYYRITFQIISSPGTWVLHNYFFSPIDIGVNCEMRYMQFEKKDHATPYTPTSRESMLVNEAGYSGNGTLYNSSLSTDTASGTLSCHTPRILPDSINTMVSTSNAAYVYADVFGYNYTPTEFTVAWWWKVIDWGYGTGPFGLVTSNGNYMDSTLGVHDGAVYVNFTGGNTRVSRGFTGGGTGKWTHFAITFKPGSYTSYINGVSQGTATTDASLTLDPWRYLYLGAGCAGGCLRDGNIYWGDFRYYNTCLSESDIAELYKTKAYITDNGDIKTHQFIEGKSQAQVTHKYCFEADEFYEELYPGYDVLEYIESSGTQYVDTGYVTTSTDYTYELDMSPTKIGGFYSYMGFMASGTTPRAGVHENSNVFMLGADTTTSSSTQPVVNERVVLKGHFKSGAQKLYKNGTLIASNSTSFNHSANTLSTHIFGRNYSSGRNLTSIKLYSAKIYEGTTLVRHYIPVRRQSDNALGLYELLNGTFHANSGSGTFVSGSAITNKSASIYEDMHVSGREIIEF